MERDDFQPKKATKVDISTHTLTWSVTLPCCGAVKRICNFNSHAHVERDDIVVWGKSLNGDFNSHAHVERDETIVYITTSGDISTHTLTWSVTISRQIPVWVVIISTHTLTWSVTC